MDSPISFMNQGIFMAAGTDFDKSNIVLTGVPFDSTCSYRAGARFGPSRIRQVSYSLEEYSIYQDKSLSDMIFCDAGDLELDTGNIDYSHNIIAGHARYLLHSEKIPVFIGGDHSISIPIIKEFHDFYGDDLVLLQLDAHADARDGYLGCVNSHASVIRRASGFMPGKNIYQCGIRSGSAEEIEFAQAHTNLFKFDIYEAVKGMIPVIRYRPLYVTLDIDVLDPAFANGTGTPEPGGVSSSDLLDTLMLLKDCNIRGLDIVEVSPPYDASDRTAVIAAKIIREFVLMIC